MEKCKGNLKSQIFDNPEAAPAGTRNPDVFRGVCRWAREITGALAFIHSQEVVHGDLKLENILVWSWTLCFMLTWEYWPIKTVQIPGDCKFVSSDLKSPVFLFNLLYSVPRPLYNNLPLNYRYRQKTSWGYWTRLPYTYLLSVKRWPLHLVTWNGHGVVCFCSCCRNCDATSRETHPWNLPANDTALVTVRPQHRLASFTKKTLFTTTLTNRAPTSVYQRNWKIEKRPFLDYLVSRENNDLRTTVYRKPTHADRLLDESSYNPTSHKATTMKTSKH